MRKGDISNLQLHKRCANAQQRLCCMEIGGFFHKIRDLDLGGLALINIDVRLTHQLRAATDVTSIHAICREICNVLAFEHFIFGVRVPIALSQPFHFCLSGYPPEWRARYDAMGYLKVDPLVTSAFASMLPLCWDELQNLNPTAQILFHEAAEYGLCHGISAPVIGRNGDIGIFSMARQLPLPDDESARLQLKAQVHWFATVLHETVHNILLTSKKPVLPKDSLTAREKDCLACVADGKTTAEIAALLDISERTVLFHIDNAGRKLGVSGRHNIVARSITLGEIQLSRHALSSSRPLPPVHETLH